MRNDLLPGIVSSLRCYQLRAVYWMLSREDAMQWPSPCEEESPLHPSWARITPTLKTGDVGKAFFINFNTGSITSKDFVSLPLPRGGMLADMAGLGKTLEIIALIVLHKNEGACRKFVSDYENQPRSRETTPSLPANGTSIIEPPLSDVLKEGACMQPIGANATLIVCPALIVKQWLAEIKKHTSPGTIKAMFYEGAEFMSHPDDLAHYDVVVTTNMVLWKDSENVLAADHEETIVAGCQHQKIPFNLNSIKWWRLCVDEAVVDDMQQGMIPKIWQRIQAENKWFVTGTPIREDLHDLHGLLVLLQVEPYQTMFCWNNLLWQPYLKSDIRPIAEVFSKLMWRSDKKEVAEEMDLPVLTETIEWLQLSPKEEDMYGKQQELCKKVALQVLDCRFKDQQVTISMSNVSDPESNQYQLLNSLEFLCNRCTQPLGNENVNIRPKDVVLREFCVRAQANYVRTHAEMMLVLNYLADIYKIQQKWHDALECYRTSMSIWRDHNVVMASGCPGTIIALKALDALLRKDCCSSSRALDEETLPEQAAELTIKYYQKKASLVTGYWESFKAASSACTDLEAKLNESEGGVNWFGVLLDTAARKGWNIAYLKEDIRLLAIANHCPRSAKSQDNLLRFKTLCDIKEWLLSQWADVLSKRRKLLELCTEPPSDKDVEGNYTCWVPLPYRFANKCHHEDPDKCLRCRQTAALWEYMLSLYGCDFPQPEGTQPTLEHLNCFPYLMDLRYVLKAVVDYAMPMSVNSNSLVETALIQSDMCMRMISEIAMLFPVWYTARDWATAYDTVNRFKVSDFNWLSNQGNILGEQPQEPTEEEVELRRQSLLDVKDVWGSRLKERKGQFLYLQSLVKGKEMEDELPETCPICLQPLESIVQVLSCGHHLCYACFQGLSEHRSVAFSEPPSPPVKQCPVCRGVNTSRHTLCRASIQGRKSKHTNIKGGFSTKIEAIIAKIIKIHQFEPNSKIVIYSQWMDTLQRLAAGLRLNRIPGEACTYFPIWMTHGANFKQMKKNLTLFRALPRFNVLLLLCGERLEGLSITEASHIILCEPFLLPALEQRAVGHIQRMGQTRPTTVHKFCVKGTVEEKLYNLFYSEGAEFKDNDERLACQDPCLSPVISVEQFRRLFGDS